MLYEKIRIAQSIKAQEARSSEELMKIEKTQEKKTKNIEAKAVKREKIHKEIKENLDKSLQKNCIKNRLRKQDQEKNLDRLRQQHDSIRIKLLEKCKENDSHEEMDLIQLKAKLENQLRIELMTKQ